MTIPVLGFDFTLNDDPERSGVGLTLFVCGCPHRCLYCHNKQSWNVENGVLLNLKQIKDRIDNSLDLIDSFIFCGGEPLLYENQIKEINKYCKEKELKTILYTGYKWHGIDSIIREEVDIIIDDIYMDELKQNTFPASKNQNVYINGKMLSDQEINDLPINKMEEYNA